MRFLSATKTTATAGFTLIEVLVVAPIVILMIGAFIVSVVTMTGTALRAQGNNDLIHNVQNALNMIEQDVRTSGAFLAQTNIPLQPGQSLSGTGTTSFKNVAASERAIILSTAATTKSPFDPQKSLVYLKSQPNACGSAQLSQNEILPVNIVYYIKDSTLWRRSVAPKDYDVLGCTLPWQLPSCTPSSTGVLPAFCKAQDIKLLEGISLADFKIDYYAFADQANSLPNAMNPGLSANTRETALSASNTVEVTLKTSKKIAGKDTSQKGTIRATRLGPSVTYAPPVLTSVTIATQPAATTTVPAGSTAVISVTASGTAPTYQWQQLANGSSTWLPVAGATSATLALQDVKNSQDGTRYRVIVTGPASTITSGIATLKVGIWGELTLTDNWSIYNPYWAVPSYAKTDAGVIILRGLLNSQTSKNIAILPPEYRPSQRLIFETLNSDIRTRVDIHPNGLVEADGTQTGWLSLNGISFVPTSSNLPTTALNTAGGWTHFGSPYSNVIAQLDGVGRVNLQGLARRNAGSFADRAVFAPLPAAMLPQRYLHLTSMGAETAHTMGIDMTSGVGTKGVSTSWQSVQAQYYPGTAAGGSGWQTLPLVSGWVARDSANFPAPQFIRASDKVVTLRGLIQSGSVVNGSTIATLPVGYRPADNSSVIIPSASNGAVARVDVLNDGRIVVRPGVSNAWLSLDSIRFIAEQ